jgi:hypothetical protein
MRRTVFFLAGFLALGAVCLFVHQRCIPEPVTFATVLERGRALGLREVVVSDVEVFLTSTDLNKDDLMELPMSPERLARWRGTVRVLSGSMESLQLFLALWPSDSYAVYHRLLICGDAELVKRLR